MIIDGMMDQFQKQILEPNMSMLIQGKADPRRVTRALFMVMPIYLERKAITKWIQANREAFSPMMFPQGPRAVLPEINTPYEAAELAARELMLNSQEAELVKIIVSAGEGLQDFFSEIETSLTTRHRMCKSIEQPGEQRQNNNDAKEIRLGSEVFSAYLRPDGAYVIVTVFKDIEHVKETCSALNRKFEDRGYKFVIERNIKDPNNPFSEIDYTIKAITLDNYNRMVQSQKEDFSLRALEEVLSPTTLEKMKLARMYALQRNEELRQMQKQAHKQNPGQ